ncbi:MAG: hypothetical protein IKZ38_04735 [Clostridia bacterium]|nr:hypothetical protein [Clostridia bacterium]
MFGYVKNDIPNTYVKDVVLYKAMYCGLCKSIGNCCGQNARFLLSYDLTFLSLLLHNLSGTDVVVNKERCIVHPIRKRSIAKPTKLSEDIGALNVILAYYKICDDVLDDNSGRLKRSWFTKAYKKAKKRLPEIDNIVKNNFNKLLELEKNKNDSVDITSDPFGNMILEIVNFFLPNASAELKELSYDLGRWIYLIDALDDYDKDLKKGNFNVFYNSHLNCKSKKQLLSENSFEMASLFGSLIGRISDNVNKLEYKFNKDLIENILRLGLREQTKNVMENKKCKNTTKF